MAFFYFTSETIKAIDPDAIPESFIEYFNDLSDDMKKEIKTYHPELYAHLMEDAEKSELLDFDLFEDSDLSVEEQRIIDKWESISVSEWHKDTIAADVLVCKVIPDGVRRCKIHKRELIQKQIKYKDGSSIYGHYGYLCPDCMDLYIDESKIGSIIENLDKRNHKMWIQTVEYTMQEWSEFVEPIEIKDDEIIYIPDSWAEVDMRCPEDGGILIEDTYKKTYKEEEVRFDACKCQKCKKLLMRSSYAQQLNLDCGRIGIPEIDFARIKPPAKKIMKSSKYHRPDFFVQNGDKTVYDYDDKEWEELTESETLVVSYSRVCGFDDHDSSDQLVLVRVDERKGFSKEYLLLVGYCEDCGKYYIAKEDYEIIYNAGRPNVSIYDDTCSDFYIQSGAVFDEEKRYLGIVEEKINSSISNIKDNPDYVSRYAVNSGGYDEGGLAFKKELSKPLQEKINELAMHTDKPYGYRVELVDGNTQKIFYFGASDFEIGGEVIYSFSSDWGREMVNYRNIKISFQGSEYQVKRRRQFDIDRACLYGYLEQSDEDAIFREGLTDPFLVRVLNMRKRQHQLIDITITIQEDQNKIIDTPLSENIIVQGCAGSGKTVVMLQRLSALKYSNKNFDFGRVIVLTPNENFNTHISGLASSLQLGYVERMSVEKYYIFLLLKYSEDFKLKYDISDEINVNQVYVDYIYSDEFLQQFWEAYDAILEETKLFHSEAMGYSKIFFRENELKNVKTDNVCFELIDICKLINAKIERFQVDERKKAYEFFISAEIDENEREKIIDFLDKIEGYSFKSVYNQVYEKASKVADEILYLKTGKRYLRGTKGTHRYDLYLQLLFAQKLFGYNAGDNNLLCIDEGQDLSINEYKIIKSINSGETIFNIYGDVHQLLKENRGIKDWNALDKEIQSPKKLFLNGNFRNTNQITQFCNDTFKMNVTLAGVDGHKVTEIIRSKFESKLAELNVGDERIAILLPRAVKKKDYIDLEQLPIQLRELIGDQIGNGRICVSYVDEVKGIEFDKVYVIPNGLSINEKYIAYTRALSELTLVYDEELEEKIREKEDRRQKAQEKAIKKANENASEEAKKTFDTKAGKNINFGRVKQNKAKATEYADSKIEYSFVCKRCNDKIDMTAKAVNKYRAEGLELPKICVNCQRELEEVIEIGKCQYCGKPMMMQRGAYEHMKATKKLKSFCDDCLPLAIEEKKLHDIQIYTEIKCCDCKKKFAVTYGEKDFYESKGWKMPIRCKRCRNKRKRF